MKPCGAESHPFFIHGTIDASDTSASRTGSPCRPASPKDSVRSELRGPQRAEKRLGNAMADRSRALFFTNHKTPQNAVILALHGTRFETMAILVKALKCATKRLHAFP